MFDHLYTPPDTELELIHTPIHRPKLRVCPKPFFQKKHFFQKVKDAQEINKKKDQCCWFLGGSVAVPKDFLTKDDMDLLLMKPYASKSAPGKKQPFSMATPIQLIRDQEHVRVPRGFAFAKFKEFDLFEPILDGQNNWSNLQVEEFPKIQIKPRLYQERVLKHLFSKLTRFPYHGILNESCGLGKTYKAIYIACQLRCRTLIITPNNELGGQWPEKILEYCPNATVGKFSGVTNKIRQHGHFCVASMTSLSMLDPNDLEDRAFLNEYEFCVMDECHLGCAKERSKCMHHVRSTFVLGLSATLNRSDRLAHGIEYLLGPILYRLTYLCSVDVQPIRLDDPTFNFVGQRWDKSQCNYTATISALVNCRRRNNCINRIIRFYRQYEQRKTVALSRQLACLDYLHELMGPEESGLVARPATSAKKKLERQEAKKRDVLLGSESMAATGLDKEDLDLMVPITPMKGGKEEDMNVDPRESGGGATLQQAVGRLMRRNSDKRWPLVLEIYDSGNVGSVIHGIRSTRVRFFRQNKCNVLPEIVVDVRKEGLDRLRNEPFIDPKTYVIPEISLNKTLCKTSIKKQKKEQNDDDDNKSKTVTINDTLSMF